MWNNKSLWDWNFGSWKQSRITGYWKKAVFCSVLWCLESLKLAGSSALDIAPGLTAAANSAELVHGILLTQRNSSGTQLVPGVLLERAGGATRTPAAGQPCATESFSSAWICQGYRFLDREVCSNLLLMLLEWSNPPPQCFYSLTFNLQLKTTAKTNPYTKRGHLKHPLTIVKRNWQMLYTCKRHGHTTHVRCTCWDIAVRCRCCLRPIHLGLCSSTDSSGNVWRWTLKPITTL